MLRDARSLPDRSRIETDVCVIGAGPAGIALSLQLASPSRSVLLLESGGLAAEPESQDAAAGESIGESYFPLSTSVVRAFGGTSNHWWTTGEFRTRPLDPIDFAVRQSVPFSGWPFGRDELDPFYVQAQAFLGAGPFEYELEDWVESIGGELPLDPAVIKTVLFQVIPGNGIAHYLPTVRRSPSVELLHHAHAAELVGQSDSGHVGELHVRVPGGNRLVVVAQKYVLAGGALSNARLLLVSDSQQLGGLGNAHGLVGRYFMEHLGLRGATLELLQPERIRELALYDGIDTGLCRVHGKLSLAPERLEEQGLLNGTFFLSHVPPSSTAQAVRSFVILRRALSWRPRPPRLREHLRHVLSDLPAIARTTYRSLVGGGRSTAIQLHAMAEQAPNPRSRVMLADTTDMVGVRRVRLDWQVTDHDRASIVRAEQLVGHELERAGVGKLVDLSADRDVRGELLGQWHHMGTTRMHPDVMQGVVDADSLVHGTDNVWVTGGSVFPTGGYVNPTLTVVALAYRLASHLASPRPR